MLEKSNAGECDDSCCESSKIVHMARGYCMGDFPVNGLIVVDCDIAKPNCFFHPNAQLGRNHPHVAQYIEGL